MFMRIENIYTKMRTLVFIEALIIDQKMETTQISLSTNEWINKMYILLLESVEYYWAITRNKVLMLATTSMNLEDDMLSKDSQSQKTTYCMILSLGKRLK